jgi:GrpB-like predicted nucleotidyltransferase (UPF0157 family)
LQTRKRRTATVPPPIEPYHHDDPASPVLQVARYDRRAPRVAKIVSELIIQQVGAVAVEHVGSTAVPGCDGKGIVDLMIVADPEARITLVAGLRQLGFQSQSGGLQHPDERPMLEGALQFEGARFRIHVHVVPSDSPEPDAVRRFRDRLQASPALRNEYISLKRAILDSGVTEREQYSRSKSDFITRVLGDSPAD